MKSGILHIFNISYNLQRTNVRLQLIRNIDNAQYT